MSSLTTFSIRNVLTKNVTIFSLLIMLLITSGCSLPLPDDVEEGGELSLASRIERVAGAPTAVWDADDREIVIRGANLSSLGNNIAISNGSTGAFIGAANFDDDDDDDDRGRAELVLNNVTTVPCSVTVQVGGQLRTIVVRNAPANCVGTTNSVIGATLQITRASYRASSNKLTIKGDGAIPRQLVSVFDGVTGQLLGTDQSNAVGKWKVKVRNLTFAPCLVSVVSDGHTVQSVVNGAPANCANIPGSLPIPGTGFPTFNQAPDGAIIGPIADMAVGIGSSVNFFGTGFDPDSGVALTYRWDFDFPNPNDPAGFSSFQNPTVVFTQAGVYRVTLTVTDSAGLSDPTPDTRVIVVQPNIGVGGGNQPPSGSIVMPNTNVEINAGGFVNFAGSGFDPDGTVTNYIWNFAGGALNSSQQNPGNVVFTTPGVYLVSLTVIDNSGLADPTPEFVAVTVRGGNTGIPGSNNPTNQAPNGEITSPATDITIPLNSSIDFTATAFDADSSGRLSYRWNFGNAAPGSTQLNPGQVTFNQTGVYTVTFTVTDNLGMSDLSPSVRVITVTGGNVNNIAPESSIILPSVNMTVNAGESVNFMGSGSDLDNNQPLSYIWNFGNATVAPSTSQNPGPVIFTQPGTYIVTLTVTDSLGAADATPATRIITVLPGNNIPGSGNTIVNLPPEGLINSPASNLIINVGQEVEFTGSGSDPENNSPLIYYWDFDGAGMNSMVQNPGTMVFNQAGSYRIRLMVKDSLGNVDPTPAERIITVNSPFVTNLAPTGSITMRTANNVELPGSATINAGEALLFQGSGQDQDGVVTSYEWDFGGAAAVSTQQSPGQITFNEPGIFKVTLYVKDNAGFYDTTPEVRFVTVNNTGNLNQAPNAKIVSPATDVTINAGDSILFSGMGEDLDNFGNVLTYSWNFAGAAPNSSQSVPGLVQFTQPGTYTVSLSVMDSFGLTDVTPAIRTITVADRAINKTTTVSLDTTLLRTNIGIGETLIFSANADSSDPSMNIFSYYWNFDGAAPDSDVQNPGAVTFNKAGVYNISVVASDALHVESQPATFRVTVGTIPFGGEPNATIITPTNDLTIMLGETINFIGSGVDPDGGFAVLNYRWNFDGVTASSNSQNPGNVTFNKVGVFEITLTVSDVTGATDLTPAIRRVTVTANSSGFPGNGFPGTGGGAGQAPNGIISAPTLSVTNIAVGQAVNFAATAIDPDNNLPIAYRWRFGNGMPDSFVQNPGAIVFTVPGVYTVSLTVTDSLGFSDTTPAVVTVIVGSGTGTGTGGNGNVNTSSAPDGVIDSPTLDVVISRGESVFFSGSATDPNGDLNITYAWDFGGGAVNSSLQTPGNITFQTSGQYIVKLTVTDSTGQVDSTPMVRIITVLP